VPFAALPRWQACQRVLVKALQGDKMSADATRVLRVIGTVNSKTKSVVKAEMLNPQRYDFDWLCDQILPVERAKLRDAPSAPGAAASWPARPGASSARSTTVGISSIATCARFATTTGLVASRLASATRCCT
jgi:hypothetical protein